MSDRHTASALNWFIKICKWLWKSQSFFWSTIVFNIVLGALTTLAFTSPNDLKNLPIELFLQNPLLILVIFITFVSFTCIIGLGSHLPEPTTHPPMYRGADEQLSAAHENQQAADRQRLEQFYLRRTIRERELLTLKGIPAGLMAQSIPLDEVFIPLHFRPHKLLSDYPLTETELKFYRDLIEQGTLSEQMEKILFDAEKEWFLLLKNSDAIPLERLWQNMTRRQPAAVIQGYPGIGKSTLLAGLALYMAHGSLGQIDQIAHIFHGQLEPPLIPVVLSLSDYANENDKRRAEKDTHLTLKDYLVTVMERTNNPHIPSYMQECLQEGRCLVMMDGLDEISNLKVRRQIQESIRNFVLDHSDTGGDFYNRFIITSRVAGYDQEAFDYPHYTIAELTIEQIESFLPRWYRANVRRNLGFRQNAQAEQEEIIERDAVQMSKELSNAVKHHRGVRNLAENPLLLTLLAVMQQNSIELPRQRVDLYRVVTLTLLENRNVARGLPVVYEAEAMQNLGPIAFEMQETRNSFARQKVVLASLETTIASYESSSTNITATAEDFLRRVRERGGLFILRTSDYFGFFHRTFQEYFAARYIINEIKVNKTKQITSLVEKAQQSDDLWREPFLLAVAYKSGENEVTARQIIRELVDGAGKKSLMQRAHDVLLGAECLIEAKPFSIDISLEDMILHRLLAVYTEAWQIQEFKICDQIEDVLSRQLLILPTFRSSLPQAIGKIMSGEQGSALQHITLQLFTMTAGQIAASPANVFHMLIPPLLALTDLPAIEDDEPDAGVFAAKNLDIADLAFSVLSYLGRKGPPGLVLKKIRRQFEEHPTYFFLLARLSLENGLLLTPTVVPQEEDNFCLYQEAIQRWIILRNSYNPTNITIEDINSCKEIHQSLLDATEELRYPGIYHFMDLLRLMENRPILSWRHIWQGYLADLLLSAPYVIYQEAALLWIMLSTNAQDVQELLTLVLNHYYSDQEPFRHYAQRFIAAIGDDLRDVYDSQYLDHATHLRYFRDLRDMRYLRDIRDVRDIQDYRSIQTAQHIEKIRWFRDWRDLQELQYWREMRDWTDKTNIQNMHFIIDMRVIPVIEDVRTYLFTPSISERAQKRLPVVSPDDYEYSELLTIILGRILHILETQETGQDIEQELQQIVTCISEKLLTLTQQNVCEAVLAMISYLPARSAGEIHMLQHIAENTANKRVHQSCAGAISRSTSCNEKARDTIKTIAEANIDQVSGAAMTRLAKELT
ncbi:MAG TPA: NACHT domain-containing protein [Ktedonobacteraceae bacterium]|jgi:hypothetical protein